MGILNENRYIRNKMKTILDKMFIKRLCLPTDVNIDLYENGTETVSPCVCGHYNHVSCVLQGKWKFEEG